MKKIYIVKTYFNNGFVETNAAYYNKDKADKFVEFLKKHEDMVSDAIDYFEVKESEISDEENIYREDNIELLVL